MTTQPSNNVIKIANIPLDGYDRTYLTSDVAVADTELSVISTAGDNFKITPSTDDYYILAGDYGDEKAEIKLATATSCTTVLFTTAAITHSHSASDPVTFIPYNQIKIIGIANTGDTPDVANTIDTIDIDVTKQYTSYIYTGSTYSYFVTAYFNSTDDTISAYSDEIGGSSFGRNSAKRIIESGLRKAQTSLDENEGGLLNWDVALSVINDGLDEIMTTKKKWIFLHKIEGTSTDTVNNTSYVSIPSDLSALEFLIVNDYKLRWISKLDYDYYTKNGAVETTGEPSYYTIKNGKYYLYPVPNGVYDVIYEYYKYPTEITDPTDDVDREFAAILMYYCAYQFASIRGNTKKATELYGQFEKVLERQRIQYSGPSQVGDGEGAEQTNSNNWQ